MRYWKCAKCKRLKEMDRDWDKVNTPVGTKTKKTNFCATCCKNTKKVAVEVT